MKSLNKTVVLLFVALVFTIAVGAAYAFFFVSIKDKTDATAELASRITDLSGKESSLASSVSTLKSTHAGVEKLSSLFFSEADIVVFEKKIEALGPQSGAAITIESLEPGVTEKTVPFLNLRIRATGKFSDIDRLLVLLENFPGKIDWKTVHLEKGSASPSWTQTGGGSVWSVDIFLSVLNFVK